MKKNLEVAGIFFIGPANILLGQWGAVPALTIAGFAQLFLVSVGLLFLVVQAVQKRGVAAG